MEDLLTILEEKTGGISERYKLEYLQVSSGTGVVPTATLRVSFNGEMIQEAACGDGPVDAVYKAIDKIMFQQDSSLHPVAKPRKRPRAAQAPDARLQALVSQCEDEALRAALLSLGGAIEHLQQG